MRIQNWGGGGEFKEVKTGRGRGRAGGGKGEGKQHSSPTFPATLK